MPPNSILPLLCKSKPHKSQPQPTVQKQRQHMAVSAAYSTLVVVVIVTVVFMVGWSPTSIKSPETGNKASDGFFTYEDWIHSEKDISTIYEGDFIFSYEDCLRVGFGNLWPSLEQTSNIFRVQNMIFCRDTTRMMTYSWLATGKPYPPHGYLDRLMKMPSFWRDHKKIYDIIIALSRHYYIDHHRGGKSAKEIKDAVGDFESYDRWIDSEKKIRFEEGRSMMTYEKCVKMEFAKVWDEEDEAQRLSRVICKSQALEMFNNWVRSDEPWPPLDFFGALMKVPSFWRNHTQIYDYIIRPAQFFNRPDGRRRPPPVTLF